MSDQVLISIITTMGGVMIALLGAITVYLEKNRRDTNRIKRQTTAVHDSINNSPESMTARIGKLATKADLKRVEKAVKRGDEKVRRELSERIDQLNTQEK